MIKKLRNLIIMLMK